MNPKRYPRLRIRKLYYEDNSHAWTVLLLDLENGQRVLARHWRCFDYDHARRIAPAIWAERDLLLTTRGAR